MKILTFKPKAPGFSYLLQLFETRTQVVLVYTIYALFAVLLILDSYYLVDFSLPVMILWSMYVVLGIWFIKRALHNKTSGLCYYLIGSSLWWSGAMFFSGGLTSQLFFFGEILLILYALSGSILMNALGGGLYIAAVTASAMISIQTIDNLSMLTTVIVVNLLTLSVGFLTSHAIDYHRKSIDQRQTRALTDYLTGLSNREGFVEHISLHRLDKGLFGLFDLNGFKEINDEHGHDFGDEVLKQVAKELKKTFRIKRISAELEEMNLFFSYLKRIRTTRRCVISVHWWK